VLIIVEGPNCAGKTTLVDRLVTQLGARVTTGSVTRLHRGPIDDRHPLDEYVVPLLGYRPGSGDHFVCDRWHVGERVYPTVFNRTTKMDFAVSAYVTQFLRSRGAVLVHMTALPSVLRSRCTSRGDETADVLRGITAEKGLFDVMCKDEEALGLPVIEITQTNPSNDALRDIRATAHLYETMAQPLTSFTTYVGGHRPTWLLFGDVRGPRSATDSAAFGPYRSTSGHYLLDCLGHTALHPSHLGLANACDVDDPEELWETLDRPKVAALGQNAARRLKKIDAFRFGAAPHPQYVRRFWHRHRAAYGRVVLDALTRGDYVPSWQPH